MILGHTVVHKLKCCEIEKFPSISLTSDHILFSRSESFQIKTGTQQGCPFSLLVFALFIEHLAAAVYIQSK